MYSECVMDVCALGHSSHLARKITCQSAKLMADRCRAGGVPIRNWRQTYNCPAPKRKKCYMFSKNIDYATALLIIHKLGAYSHMNKITRMLCSIQNFGQASVVLSIGMLARILPISNRQAVHLSNESLDDHNCKPTLPVAAPAPQNVCDLPPRRGPCRGSHTRFYFNKQTGTCRTFSYGGCGGNPNRFDKYTDCLTECGGESVPDVCEKEWEI